MECYLAGTTLLVKRSSPKRMEETLTGIQNGEFAKEWTKEQADGYPVFTRLREEAYSYEQYVKTATNTNV